MIRSSKPPPSRASHSSADPASSLEGRSAGGRFDAAGSEDAFVGALDRLPSSTSSAGKNKVQGAEGALYKGRSTLAIVRQVAATDGLRGLYRGILPGALRSFVANGAGMAVYQFTQSLRKD